VAKLMDLAQQVRSKNAGPFLITFDIMFDSHQQYEQVIRSRLLTKSSIAKFYAVDEDSVAVLEYPQANAIKITIPRHTISGNFADPDVLGCQQAAHLYDLDIPDKNEQ
jgi:hypothetical protein